MTTTTDTTAIIETAPLLARPPRRAKPAAALTVKPASPARATRKAKAASEHASARRKRAAANPTPAAVEQPTATPVVIAPTRFTKRDQVIAMLKRGEGASLDELIAATGWLPHTTRAALSGLRKAGMALERSTVEGISRYRIVG